MNIGNNLANMRKEKNLTQEELAKLINVSPKTISSYETNRSIPNIEILILLTKALDTNIETILNLNKENTEEIKQIYEKRNIKETIIKTIGLSIVFIIPMLYFIYCGYISISAFTASIYAGTSTLSEASKATFNLFLIFTYEYFIYMVVMLLNYLLYKKKKGKCLLILNGIFLIILLIDFIGNTYKLDLILFIICNIFGLVYAFKIFKNNKKLAN